MCETRTKYVVKLFPHHSIWCRAKQGTKSHGTRKKLIKIYFKFLVLFTEYEFFKEFKLYHPNSLMDKEIKFDWLILSLSITTSIVFIQIIKLFNSNQIKLLIFFTYLCFWYTVGDNILWVEIIKEHNGGEQNHLESRSTQFYNLFIYNLWNDS